MRAYSVDLRERVVAAVDRKLPRSDVAVLFGVSLATIKRPLTQRRVADTLVPKTSPGRPPQIRPEQHATLWAQLEAHPDARLTTHCELWERTQQVRISTRAMARAIRRLGWTRKKTLGATERDEQQRTAYRERIVRRDVHDFVVIDECGANIKLMPRYARAPRGQRAYASVPRNTDKNTTLIATMSTAGMGAAMLLPGATDTAAFEAYVEHVLVPTLVPDKIIVMDNLSAHKSARAHID